MTTPAALAKLIARQLDILTAESWAIAEERFMEPTDPEIKARLRAKSAEWQACDAAHQRALAACA